MLTYFLIFAMAAVIDFGAVLWTKGLVQDRVLLVGASTVFLAVIGYYNIRFIVQDELAIVPAALGHLAGVMSAMKFTRKKSVVTAAA